MDTSRLKLAVIVGSIRNGRTGPQIAEWFMRYVDEHTAFEHDCIDLVDIPLPAALPDSPDALESDSGRTDQMIALKHRLRRADAFVLVTPEYNHGIAASVKHLIDWHVLEWRHKPMSFVSYGGSAGGLRAVEHLRQVMAELQAVAIRDTVSFTNYWEHYTAEGEMVLPDDAGDAARRLLDQLAWWGALLRFGRTDERLHAMLPQT